MIGDGRVKVELDSISSVLFIGAAVYTAHDVCRAELRGSHTNFCLIEKNGRKLLEKPYVHSDADRSPIVECSIADIYDFALNTPIEQLKFMLEAYRVNEELAEAGAAWERCTITRSMIAQNGGRLISDDPRQSAKTYACAAAEARVLGIDKAAMSITRQRDARDNLHPPAGCVLQGSGAGRGAAPARHRHQLSGVYVYKGVFR